MVSSDEIRRRLQAKRRGVKLPEEGKPQPDTINCPECQTQNPSTAKFCVGCGAPMAKKEAPQVETVTSPEEQTVSPTAAEPVVEEAADYKMCPSCNQKNKLDAKFCIICGHKFEDAESSEKVAAEAPESEPQVEPVIPTTPEAKPTEQVEQVPEIESEESPVIPEIKVPEHLQSTKEEPQEKPADKVVEVPETSLESEPVPKTSSESESVQKEPVTPEATGVDVDPAEKIIKAKKLLDLGAITQEEFEKIKNKYLEQM
ncbi:zinc-ribbon domain-containing protein [Methanobacterium ferruginis]|uniref:zinc-ribbon domain-containing protein n=1 Tax=Methanobacterium ferruginis TaxID=710191 RepID=UPI00257296B4|nr:zinc-ribbon domain-containing protein [Methanobacterium ferruginis]BDZ68888.1 hypothetical protein GCM10025860_23360 [Methanobacterium ferruginis]